MAWDIIILFFLSFLKKTGKNI
ncbi:hypothetical protein CY0110_17652 [Crocosphaera chwakensis CCY0110]|uniref:Uncharacterized protein n=1 Tax=Crocosphaera chwakensis CCY0110 TaxID=391612 RepID=A3IIL2_9CHRO|nr:hypothetical protein CY0110_17652 [Crocosphaera chwakensis CCY0110]